MLHQTLTQSFFVVICSGRHRICEIHCIALDGFDLYTVHKLSSKEKKSQRSWVSNLGLLGGKQESFLCAMQPSKNLHKVRWQRLPLDEKYVVLAT